MTTTTGKWTQRILATALVFTGAQQAFAAAGDGTLTLRLFEDIGRDGQYQSAVDTPVTGVTVRAFDNDGDSVTATFGSGVYTIAFGSQAAMNGGKYRIEIDATTLPGSVDPSSIAGGSRSFTEVVNVAGNTAVTLLVPVAVPKDACVVQGDLDMLVSTYVAGGHLDSATYVNSTQFLDGSKINVSPATSPALITFPVSAMASTAVIQNHVLATYAQIGGTGGLAVQQSRNRVFAAALARRHVDYGPGGSGAIYVVDITGGGVLDTITIPNTGNTQRAVDSTNPANNGTAVEGWIRDSLMFDRVGKEALGDIEIDDAETTLWAVNLNDRHLYMVDVDTLSPGYGTVTDLGLLSATIQGDADNFRPYALKFNNGALFLGATASGQVGQNIDDVSAHVYRFTDPYNGVAMTEVYSSRINSTNGGLEYNRGDNRINWKPWRTEWNTAAFFNSSKWSGFALVYPQPILSDIEFDSNNNMLLGFRDRFGDQIGSKTKTVGSGVAGDLSSDNTLYETVSMGDILHHCWAPTAGATGPQNAVLGDWRAEGVSGCGEMEDDTNDGLSVTEHYNHTSFGNIHPETPQGGLATHPLFPNTIFTTSLDPFAIRSGGIHRFHTVDNGANDAGNSPFQSGQGAGGYQIFAGQADNGIGLPGKSNGLGDVEILCALSPLQIGNLVWYDEDGDGIRDPREVPIPGVEVKLYTDINNDTVLDLVDTVTTDNEGRYLFFADPDTTYTITVDPTTAPDFNDSASTLVDTAQLGPTAPNIASGGGNDLNDSDVDGTFSGLPAFEVVTTASRVSNHALDAGLVLQTVAIGNFVWRDDGAGGGIRNNGIFDGTEAGIDGVTVQLYRTGVDAIGAPFLSTTTAGGGFYLFDDIPQDDYFVHIPASNFAGVLATMTSSTGAGGDDTNDDNTDENGQDALVSGGVSSVSIALVAGTLPTTEAGEGTYTGNLSDENVNMTIDFGFVPPQYDLGDLPDTGAGTGAGNYQTLNSDSGPVHQLGSGLILGATVDDEADGQPNGTATGDGSDEDGVTFPALSAGSIASVDITVAGAPGGARVNAFFDWNADGDFADSGEAIPELLVNNGANTLSVPVPLTAVPGTDLGVRVRISTVGGLSSIGDAPNGEIEDYLVQVSPVVDMGDLPDTGAGTGVGNYATTEGDGGPSHRLGSGLLLGAIVDDETDGQPSTNADGDDTAGAADDEDGIVIPALVAGEIANIQYTVAGAPVVAPAVLNAYFDWNADGDFADSGEALPGLPVSNGTSSFPVIVPLGANTDEPIGMRFRLSTLGVNGPNGAANDGEVEDYLAPVTPVYDFGDNPLTYGTVLADDGPRHQIVPGIYLGATVDPDADGQPTSGADGDDVNPVNVDDEDGVVFLDPLIPGQSARVQVTASTNGFLNAWVDFDGSGGFDFPVDRIVANQIVLTGVNVITFTVPATATPGDTYSRFRFTTASEGGGEPTGLAPDGEVEDHVVSIIEVDLGDLPTAAQSGFGTSYPTTFASGGAVHQIVKGVYMGSVVDAETNGVPSVGADGDDLAGSPDDEDGVTFLDPIIPGQNLRIEVTAFDDGFLNAWIDWNGNGVLTDAGEQIATDAPMVGGVNPFTVTIPASLGAASVYSRFRFTTGQGEATTPTGFANNGEVEDYVLPVADLEFGDLPDVYGTLLASGGAAHIEDPTFFLGATLDLEADGAPSSGADGDDTADSDDEDGVTFVSAIIGGTVADVDVEASEDGFLNAWYDFNGDGDFADSGEHVFDDVSLTPGVNNLSVNVPLNVADRVYIRFRFTENQGNADTPTGIAPNGEVEDYVQPGINYDFGDLPDAADPGIYPTLMVNNGARHQILPGVHLGALIDAEGNGQPNTGADGDDVNPPTADDEDGVVVSDYLVPGYTTDIVVTASTNGFLNAWFDFDNNGSLTDAGEHLFQDVPLVPGANTLPVAVPPGATPGDLYSRFRFTTAGREAVDPTGAAPSGEVEDYLLAISPPVNLGNLVWNDADNNGTFDPGETGIDGVVVELHTNVGPPGPGNLVATDTTSGGGFYNFDNLFPGTYVVTIPTAPAAAPRSSEPTDTADNGQDNDDNGTQAATGAPTVSPAILLTPGAEPDAMVDGDGTNGDLTVDFGFYEPLSLGNIVWFDGDNSGTINGAEAGIDGVAVQLYTSSQTPGVDVPVATDTTAGGGFYLFDNLIPGDYVVFIPAANFTGVLTDHVSSTPTEATPNSDLDSNDNGINDAAPALNGIRSGVVTLAPNAEPAGETDLGPEGNGIADANSSNLTVDFGFYIPVAIGNLVWHDANNNGQVDPGEALLSGVTVELYRSTQTPGVDVPLLTDTTDGSGLYGFEGLVPGDYIVSIPSPPTGYPRSSTVTEPADNREDNDDNGIQATDGGRTTSPVINLASGAEPGGTDGDNANGDLTIDFGFFAPLNLGNLVWNDANNNGQVDPGEAGLDGVLIQLFSAGQNPLVDAPLASDTTSGGGLYDFTGLNPGQYFVYIPTPPADFPRSSEPTDTADNGQDNDDNGTQASTGAPVTSPVITLSANEEPTADGDGNNGDLTIDFGFYEPLSLGNIVWFDADNSGTVNGAEAGINGVTVQLYTLAQTPGVDAPVATDTTAGGGYYLFDNLIPGDYVVFIPAANFTGALTDHVSSTPTEATPNSDVDSNDNGINDAASAVNGIRSGLVTLAPNAEPAGETDLGAEGNGIADANSSNLTVDFGFYIPVAIGNLVWYDANNNGQVDPGENPFPGVLVELYLATQTPGVDVPLLTDTTDGSGHYGFEGLVPGDYIVSIPTPPTGYPRSSTVTDPADNREDNDDNGIQAADGGRTSSPVINLASGAEPDRTDGDNANGDLTIDFGFFAPVNLGNLVWNDANNNGQVDPGEAGIDGVLLQLFTVGQDPLVNLPVATDTTSGGGLYEFNGLNPGQYFVYIPTPPASAPRSSDVTDTADNQQDNNDNGSQAAGTGTPVTGPVVTLSSNGEPTTDGDGFNGDLTLDFGFYQPVNLGNLVWNDANNNGQVDPGEAAIPGVTVELYAAGLTPGVDVPTATDVTDGSGLYNFDDLPPGVYVVSIPTPPAAFPRSSDVSDGDDNRQDNDDNGAQATTGARTTSPAITLLAGDEPAVGVDGDGTAGDLTIDFGFYQPVNIGNLVWNDLNGNGQVDSGEPGFVGVLVELYRGNQTPGVDAPIATQPTGSGGIYNFTDLPPGDYIVSIPTPPPGLPKSSTVTDPADNGQDNDDNGAQPGGTGTRTTSPVITLLSPTEPSADGDGTAGDLTVDFGFFQPVNLGNLVWHDQNGDGLVGGGEPGIPDVIVELYLATQTPGVDSPVATDVTDPNGLYNFDDLSPGQYVVYIPVVPPAIPASSPALVTDTDDNGQDNDDNGSQPGGTGTPVTSPVITLQAGTEQGGDGDGSNGDLTVDFGFYTPVRVGDLVWNDLDGDGVQDVGEPGVTNVVVTLVNNTTLAVVSNLTTGANGEYLFTDLPPGDYFVTFDLPPGYLYTVPDSTKATDSTDSDAGVYQTGGVASTPPTGFLSSGQEDLTLDAGVYEPASLGDTVWIDVTRDGDPTNESLGALGIPGVTVDLLRILDGVTNAVATTTTSANPTNRGYYVFTDLPPGTYVVRVNTSTVLPGYPEPTTPTRYTTVLDSGENSQLEDFGFITETTAIELKSLTATEVSGGVLVSWETSSEKDNFGFLVYRSDRLNGSRTLVSPELIEGQGTGSGSSYAFLDAGVDPGRCFYWLEDLDYDGTKTTHGPAVVVVDGNASATASAGLVPVFVAGAANVAVDGEVTASVEVEGGLVVVVPAGAAVTPASGDALRLTAVVAAPAEGVDAVMSLAEDNVAVVTAKAGTNLLVGGFTSAPVAVLVSAEGRVVMEGAVLETEAGFGLYLSVPADGEVVLFAK